MDMAYIDNAEITTEFEEAIANEELEVCYQPIVDSVTGKIMSAEALIRWIHPKKGFISPGIFVPKLEEDGSIPNLTVMYSRRYVPISAADMRRDWKSFLFP